MEATPPTLDRCRPPQRWLCGALLIIACACVCVEAARSASEIHATTHTLELLPLKRQEVIVAVDSDTFAPPKEEAETYAEENLYPDAYLVIGVKSAVLRGFEARQAIRQTWANDNLTKPLGVRVVFLGCEPDVSMLGDDQQSEALRAIAEEKTTHQDLLTDELQCQDSFYTLVDKVVAFLSYAHSVHPSLAFAMVTDDDVYVRVDRLMALLKSDRIPKEGFYGGNAAEDKLRKPNAPVRDPKSRYYLPEEIYPIPELPPFVAGAQYVLSGDIVEFVALNRHDLVGLKGLDDATMAVWMLALQIHPVFLPEFQILRTWACTNDLISYADLAPPAIHLIHSNLADGRPFCSGFSFEEWLKTYRTIDFGADKDAEENGDVQTRWEVELDPALQALRITTTISVGTESVSLVYVPSAGPFMEIFCDQMLPLLETKLSILVGRNFCRHQRQKLLDFVISHDVSMPPMRPLLALTRHNLERDALDDKLNLTSNHFIAALADHTPRPLRLIIECLLAAALPDRHLVVVNEVELGDRYPHVVVAASNSEEGRIFERYPSVRLLMASSRQPTSTNPRLLHLPVVSAVFGGSLRHSPVELLEATLARPPDSSERAFCAYDNVRCDSDQQELMFDLLNEVESVKPLGRCQGSKTDERWREIVLQSASSMTPTDDAADAYSAFKFVIAFEDSDDERSDIIETIAASFLAGAVPVYAGRSPSVASLFNPRAFIDCGLFKSLHACASKVLHTHHSKTLYEAMRREPPVVNTTAFTEAFSWHPDVSGTEDGASQSSILLKRRLQRLLLQLHETRDESTP